MIVTPEHALRPAGAKTPGSSPPPAPDSPATALQPLRVARREASDGFERRYLETILERTDGNVSRAAAIAEVSRQMVQKLMRKHGVS
jgi:transcriptional regulator with GAF, ATPase, and Fis domain